MRSNVSTQQGASILQLATHTHVFIFDFHALSRYASSSGDSSSNSRDGSSTSRSNSSSVGDGAAGTVVNAASIAKDIFKKIFSNPFIIKCGWGLSTDLDMLRNAAG